MLSWLSVVGYRSVVDVEFRLAPVTVVVGGNGAGKSNLYRALVILQAAARGRLAQEFAAEGGFASALWAGPRRKPPVRMRLRAQWPDYRYELVLGLPAKGSPFPLDPVVKTETISLSAGGGVLAQRNDATAFVRDEDGVKQSYPLELRPAESLLSQLVDPRRLPVLGDVRERMLGWRTYHQFRTDLSAPMRSPRLSCFTPVLDPSGDDLAPALQTIIAYGAGPQLNRAVSAAFPGCSIDLTETGLGQTMVQFHRPGLLRPLTGTELSDGTLRFLALAAALLSPRPPGLLVLNEPETSLHEELLGPLSELILAASGVTQLWITTHSRTLAAALSPPAKVVEIELDAGETRVRGAHPLGLHIDEDD